MVYTSEKLRLRVEITIKSHVIHHWKAKVMQNKKAKLWSIFRIYTFRQNIRLNIKSSVICQWNAITIQNPKYKGLYINDVTFFRGSTDPPSPHVIKSHLFQVPPLSSHKRWLIIFLLRQTKNVFIYFLIVLQKLKYKT